VKCAICGEEFEPTRRTTYEIACWVTPREAGGTNHTRWPETTGRVMCPTCVVKKSSGISEGQLKLA